ncbi:uncharacterized protein [Argopecten irradians]|uniref:uncharacterized protein n=1 Tax=Argopecten irradians TaxID=31199 RepID=UPI0037238723
MPRGKFWRRGLAAKKGNGHPSNKGLTSDVDMGTPPVKKALVDDMGTPPVEKALVDDGLSVPFQKCFTSDIDMGTPPVKKALVDDMGTPPVEKALVDMKGTPPKKALEVDLNTDLSTGLSTDLSNDRNTGLNKDLRCSLNNKLSNALTNFMETDLNTEWNESTSELSNNLTADLSTGLILAKNTELQTETNISQQPTTGRHFMNPTVKKPLNSVGKNLSTTVLNKNRKHKPLYNIMLVTAKYERIRKKINGKAIKKQITNSKRKRKIKKKPLYNIMLITNNRKKSKVPQMSADAIQPHHNTEKCTRMGKQAMRKRNITNTKKKCLQRQKLPSNVRKISKNLVVVTEKNAQCPEKCCKRTTGKAKCASNGKSKANICSSKQKKGILKYRLKAQTNEQLQIDQSSVQNLKTDDTKLPSIKHETRKRKPKVVGGKLKLDHENTTSPEQIRLSDEMMKAVEHRIAELSFLKHVEDVCAERNVNLKRNSEQDQTHKLADSTDFTSNLDVIFEKQTGPVTYYFQKLSFCTKCKLISKLGIETNIISSETCDRRILGKPLNTKIIMGDGNCFFRALSFAISDEESHHKLLRKAVVAHMIKFQNKFNSYLRLGYKSVPEYLSKKSMLHDGTWATEVEILAAADLLQTDIYIFDEAVYSWQLFSAKQVDKRTKVELGAIYMTHCDQTHYNVVLSVDTVFAIEGHGSNKVISGVNFIEENKSPTSVDSGETIHLSNVVHNCDTIQGNFHQGHHRFSENAGKQCVLNSLSALLYSREKNMSLWTAVDLDHTLIKGDEIYGYLRQSSTMNYDYLSIPDIPRQIEYNEKMFKIEFQESLSGTFGNVEDLDHFQFVTLFEALQIALDQENVHGAFITFKGNTFIVVKQTAGYFVFDSHSRNRSGLQISDGSSILKFLHSVQEVYCHCINLARSMNHSPQDMFEVTAASVEHHHVETNLFPPNVKVPDMQKDTSLKEDTERYLDSIIHEARDVINSSKNKQTLLDKYFQYQTNMSKNKLLQSTKDLDFKSDRKQYMNNYMKKRRASEDYRIKDRKYTEKAMKKVRTSEKYCEKELAAQRATRQNPQRKMITKQNTLKSKRKARENKEFYEQEYKAQKAARQKPDMKIKTKQNTLKSMRKAREDKEFCEQEYKAQKAARQKPDMKIKTKQNTLRSKRKAREDKEFCEQEYKAQKAARQKPDMKIKTKQNTLRSKRKAREDKQFCEQEYKAQKAARQKPDIKIKTKQNNLRSKRKAREDKEFCEQEYKAQKAARQKPDMKIKTKQNTLRSKRKAREDKEFCEQEMQAKKLKRMDPLQLDCERILKQESRKRCRNNERDNDKVVKGIKRTSSNFCEHEAELSIKRKMGESIEQCIEKFHKRAAEGPLFVCTCCHQTWFPRSVVKLSNTNISEQSKTYCTGLKSQNEEEWLCRTCLVSLKEEKIPRLSRKNGMIWPIKPDVLQLHPLEERLISQRIPFMQIRELPRGGQLSAKGNVVNVPVDIQPTVNALPRQIDEHVTIAVKLKKRLSHKSACFTENVRPNAVMNALQWLMENSEMYKNAGLSINTSWKDDVQSDPSEIISEYTGKSQLNDDRDIETAEDQFCEISSDECIQGNSDTLVDEADTDTNKVYVFAPGENQRPLSLYEDKDAEYLCFPTIFCGQKRKENTERQTPVHYSDIAKWELRSVDRRAAHSVPNIFFKLKKIQAKQISDKVNLALRRCKSDGKTLTAGQARDSSTTNEIVRLNEGYYIFRTLRNSPAYLSSKKKDVFAMIRQLGLPTWFMSLSSADTRWPDLLKTLAQLDGKTLSNDDLRKVDWNFKTNLVQKDPVTCARFFDNRVQLFVNSFLKSQHNPIGDVTDTFRRVEFQNRGSPHIHMLLWTENAPRYPDDNVESLIAYVDKYITCSLQTDNSELAELVQLQVHKHSKTCKKGGKPVCRFGFPLPPLPRTMLLEPLETDVAEYRKKYTDLQKKMNEYKDGCSLSFLDFLQTIVQMEETEYIKCIRASLKGPKIFLRRNPAEMRVNYYNLAILQAWHANLDIQFVLDPYACATYIVSYISKSQRGISALLEKASQEAVEGNMDLRRQVRHIGNKFLNFVEVSAQEASYLILQMPLTQATRDVVFINTSPPDERVFLLKSQEDLENLPENSTDIKADNMITRYTKRPKQLENWCLADVVSELEVAFPKEEFPRADKISEHNEDDTFEEENFEQEDVLVHLKNGIKIRRRKNKRVIRYVGYSKKTNSEQYFRERILLFLPWRNESTDIINGYTTFEQHYKSKANIINVIQKKYENFVDELEQARLQAECELDDFDEVAPNTEHNEAEDANIGPQPSEQFVHFDPDTQCHKEYDIGPDIGLPAKTSDVQTSPVRISEQQYHRLLQSLNCKQREFHNHVSHWIQHRDEPLYAFLTGGAGTGKSVVIESIYQTLHRALCSEEGENPDDVRILLCAYTGKAAYNINGMTIASAFHKKMYQTQQNMYSDELNTYRTKYRNLSVIIIDEISMVGNKLLAFIHERLQQLTGTKQDFGGVSIIAVGDLYQLSPVGDSWIFKDLSCPGQGLAKNLWKEHFTMFELTEIMRQKDDLIFSELLNRLRHNQLTNEDKQLIFSRQIEVSAMHYPHAAPHLFIENKFVDDFNNNFMQNLATSKVNVKADTDVLSQTKLSQDVKKTLIENLPDKQANTGQLKTNLTVAVNMIYDISVNIDVADGLTNGSTCVVKHIEYKYSAVRPAIVWVLFGEEKIGAMRRHQYQHLFGNNIETSWTPIFETKRTFMYNRKTFERIQFPLQPSAAKTVHKAQGATLDKVVVSLSQSRKRKIPHIHYVALSRVRSLNNLHIIDFNEGSLSKDNDVDTEMQRLNDNGLKLCFTPLYNVEMQGKFLFNNARSFHKHFPDIKSDPNVYAADVVGIAESWLCSSDRNDAFHLQGFNMFRNDASHSQTRPHHGLITFVKSSSHVSKYENYSTENIEFSYLSFNLCDSEVQCVVIYKKPACPISHFYTIMKDHLVPLLKLNENLVIMGDFNVDLTKAGCNTFITFMESTFHCTQSINQSTTKMKSQLDLIFTNFGERETGVLEAYWSDHNMVYCAVKSII